MALWAELDENNVVVRVTIGDDNEADKGYQWLLDNLGGNWVDASTSTVGVGYTYDNDLGAFIMPKPYSSWILDEETFDWLPPTPIPDTENPYIWNEETTSWDLVEPDPAP